MNIPDDPFVRELLPEFVDSWITDINEQFQPYVDERKTDELYRLAHTLKGSCYQFGLNDVGDMGVELMEYAKEEEWEKAVEMKSKIIKRFNEIKSELEAA